MARDVFSCDFINNLQAVVWWEMSFIVIWSVASVAQIMLTRLWEGWDRLCGPITHTPEEQIYYWNGILGSLETSSPLENGKCEACIYRKQSLGTFQTSSWRENKHLESVHSDIYGPLDISLWGCRYILLFIYDFSRMNWVYFLKKEVISIPKMKTFRQLVGNEVKKRIGILNT